MIFNCKKTIYNGIQEEFSSQVCITANPKRERARKRAKDAYETNPEPAKRRSKEAYNDNPGPKRTYEREKARSKKKDSSANNQIYNESIKYGPLFVCVCCHRGLFENSVKPFTEILQNRTMTKLQIKSYQCFLVPLELAILPIKFN